MKEFLSMEEKKTDRRTLKTRKAICDALMGFLTEKQGNCPGNR